jgi:hypothetical protein
VTPPRERPSRRFLLPAAVGLVYFSFCLATLSRQYTFDAISYLWDVEQTRLGLPLDPAAVTYNFFHSQHLLFSPVVYLFYHFCAWWGYTGSALAPAQFLNLLEGSLALGLVCRLLLELTEDGFLAAVFSAVLGLSYAFWYNTAMISDHMASCLLAVVYVAMLHRTHVGSASGGRLALLGFVNGFAMLMHQVNGLLGAVFLLALALDREAAGSRLRRLVVYTGAATATVAVPYAVVGIFILGNTAPYDFVFWSFYYAMPGVINVAGHYGTVSVGKLGELAAGFGASWVGGFYWMNRVFEERALQLFAVPLFSCLAAAALLASAAIARLRAPSGALSESLRRMRRYAAAWFLSYALLLFWWWPSYYQLWAVPLVGGVLWTGIWFHRALAAAPARRAAVRNGLLLAAGALFAANLIAAYLPMRDAAANEYLTTTESLGPHTKPGDLVVVPGNDEYETYIPYFLHRDVVSLHAALIDHENDLDASLEAIGTRMDSARAARGRVFIVSELRDTVRLYADVYDLHGISNDDVAAYFRTFAVEETVKAGSLTFYRIRRAPADAGATNAKEEP